MTGLLFATGRRTVPSWLPAGQLSQDYLDYYYFLTTVGRKVEMLAGRLLGIVAQVVVPGERVVLAYRRYARKRYGPKVEGAGLHHNPMQPFAERSPRTSHTASFRGNYPHCKPMIQLHHGHYDNASRTSSVTDFLRIPP